MHFDVIFLDDCTTKYYDRSTLEKKALGGTEASLIRVAEGLAALGLKVAVVECNVPYFAPTMGQHCFFLHVNDVSDTTCKHYIQLRGVSQPQMFPGAKRYTWLHDLADEKIKAWEDTLLKGNYQVIAVSRWHKNSIKEYLPNYEKITHIYNPVPDEIYVTAETPTSYDRNVLIWTSSPHKGLGKALEMFKTIRARNNRMQLIVCNPGYFNLDTNTLATIPGVSVYGSMACKNMWAVIQKTLCVFYPCQFDETFGLVAAEANALGTPIATYRKAALKEIVSSENQTVDTEDESGLIDKVINWSENGRPLTLGRDGFKHSEILMNWVKLLAK